MRIYGEAFLKLKESILGNDLLILIAGIVALAFMIVTIVLAKAIKIRTKEWKKNKNAKFSKFLLHGTSKFYTLFVTMISIFPLLGMLGTVIGLLGLDLASGDMDNIKNNFFIALTSTAWGIIFSVIFKVAHAWIADNVEEQIETAKKLTDGPVSRFSTK